MIYNKCDIVSNECVYIVTSGPNVVKLITFVKSFSVPGKPFQPNLIFTNKSGAYLSEATFRCSIIG